VDAEVVGKKGMCQLYRKLGGHVASQNDGKNRRIWLVQDNGPVYGNAEPARGGGGVDVCSTTTTTTIIIIIIITTTTTMVC